VCGLSTQIKLERVGPLVGKAVPTLLQASPHRDRRRLPVEHIHALGFGLAQEAGHFGAGLSGQPIIRHAGKRLATDGAFGGGGISLESARGAGQPARAGKVVEGLFHLAEGQAGARSGALDLLQAQVVEPDFARAKQVNPLPARPGLEGIAALIGLVEELFEAAVPEEVLRRPRRRSDGEKGHQE
jgi:hypothetical protein